jgi:hypothetical protein
MMRWNREAAMLGIPDLPEEGFKHVGDRKIKPHSGGGGGSGKQTVEQTNVPSWARPQFEDMLGRGIALSQKEYQPYGGERIADLTDLQKRAVTSAGNLGVASQIGDASGIAKLAAEQGMFGSTYQPGSFTPTNIQAPTLEQFQMGPAMQVGADRVGSQNIEAAQTGFRPDLQQFQIEGPQSFTQAGTADQYMSPYMQQVVDIQKREAQRQADIASTQRGAQAVRAGAFGGSRQAILDAEAQRNLAQQMGDIQATGSQSAFEQARAQFNQEQQDRLAAEQENLRARLGVQELGTTTGLQTALANLTADQQTRVQNEANRLQAGGMDQDAALRAALANQQAGLTTDTANLEARLGVQALGSGQEMDAARLNQQAILDAEKAFEQSRQFGAGFGQEGLNIGMRGAELLGGLGDKQFRQELETMAKQFEFGSAEQQLIQRILDQQYGDFREQRGFDYEQLGFLSDMLRGTGSSTRTVYQPPTPSALQTAVGLGTTAAGFMAKGGEVRYANGGITGLPHDAAGSGRRGSEARHDPISSAGRYAP